MTPAEAVKNVLKQEFDEWLPDAINNGNCLRFAEHLALELPGAEVISYNPGHACVLYEGRYYDSETPDGVDEPWELPCCIRFGYDESNWTTYRRLDEEEHHANCTSESEDNADPVQK